MASLTSNWRDASIGSKLAISNFLLVLVFFSAFIFTISHLTGNMIETTSNTEVAAKTKLAVDLASASDRDLRARDAALGDIFRTRLAGKLELGTDNIDIAGIATPVLKLNDKPLNLDFSAVDQGNALVDQAGTTMNEVVSSIRRVTDIMGEISAASGEQSAGVAQIGNAVTEMDQVTQQSAALVEQMAAAAGSLKSQAQELVQVVSVFKLGAGGRA